MREDTSTTEQCTSAPSGTLAMYQITNGQVYHCKLAPVRPHEIGEDTPNTAQLSPPARWTLAALSVPGWLAGWVLAGWLAGWLAEGCCCTVQHACRRCCTGALGFSQGLRLPGCACRGCVPGFRVEALCWASAMHVLCVGAAGL